MIEIQRSAERGHADHGWLYARHSFSFSEYFNRARMNFGALRVLNEDVIQPAQGFGMHAHDNMEIVTIVLEGALEHQDSQNNRGVIRPGDVQRMSAGSGIRHSEFNHSQTEKVHLLQIWVYPKERGITPAYEQKTFSKNLENRFVTLVSGEKNSESIYLHQDAVFSRGRFKAGTESSYQKKYAENGIYIFMIQGQAAVEDESLQTGDAASLTGLSTVLFSFQKDSDLLLIEVPLDRP